MTATPATPTPEAPNPESSMPAFVVHRPGSAEVDEVERPQVRPGEVVAEVVATGICGSDLEVLDGRRPEEYVRYPVVIGHEWVGRVNAVGAGVTRVRPGDGIVAEGLRNCGTCPRCAEGRTNLCAGEYAETGFTHPGAMAEMVAVPASQVHPLPDAMTSESAALLEPAACVAGGLLEVGYPAPGARVAVVGDGPLGLLGVMLLTMSGPRELILVGRRGSRMAQGRALGATGSVDARDTDALASMRGRFDLVVEATNAAAGIASALTLPRRGGTAVLLGISGSSEPAIEPDVFALAHLRVQGVFAASRSAWQHVVGLYGAGAFDPAPLVSHRFGLSDTAKALDTLRDRDAGAVKVLIHPHM